MVVIYIYHTVINFFYLLAQFWYLSIFTNTQCKRILIFAATTGLSTMYIYVECQNQVMKTTDYPHVKTEEWRPAENGKTKCEDCIINCGDPKINFGWLDPNLV